MSGGGFPGWLQGIESLARVSNAEYDSAWKEWLTAVDKYLVPNEIGKGGPVILNQIGKGAGEDKCWLVIQKRN